MTALVRIDVDGTVTRLDSPVIPIVIDGAPIEIVSCVCPPSLLDAHDHPILLTRQAVMAVKAWGRVDGDLVNFKAWAVYGRSPICGPAIIGLDLNDYPTTAASRDPLPETWLTLLEGPPEAWLTVQTIQAMLDAAEREGCSWPVEVERQLRERL